MLPQYAEVFRSNAIMGFDFHGLMEKNGELLRTELGIESKLHRQQIIRGMTMHLFGMGTGEWSFAPSLQHFVSSCHLRYADQFYHI